MNQKIKTDGGLKTRYLSATKGTCLDVSPSYLHPGDLLLSTHHNTRPDFYGPNVRLDAEQRRHLAARLLEGLEDQATADPPAPAKWLRFECDLLPADHLIAKRGDESWNVALELTYPRDRTACAEIGAAAFAASIAVAVDNQRRVKHANVTVAPSGDDFALFITAAGRQQHIHISAEDLRELADYCRAIARTAEGLKTADEVRAAEQMPKPQRLGFSFRYPVESATIEPPPARTGEIRFALRHQRPHFSPDTAVPLDPQPFGAGEIRFTPLAPTHEVRTALDAISAHLDSLRVRDCHAYQIRVNPSGPLAGASTALGLAVVPDALVAGTWASVDYYEHGVKRVAMFPIDRVPPKPKPQPRRRLFVVSSTYMGAVAEADRYLRDHPEIARRDVRYALPNSAHVLRGVRFAEHDTVLIVGYAYPVELDYALAKSDRKPKRIYR